MEMTQLKQSVFLTIKNKVFALEAQHTKVSIVVKNTDKPPEKKCFVIMAFHYSVIEIRENGAYVRREALPSSWPMFSKGDWPL